MRAERRLYLPASWRGRLTVGIVNSSRYCCNSIFSSLARVALGELRDIRPRLEQLQGANIIIMRARSSERARIRRARRSAQANCGAPAKGYYYVKALATN